MEEKGYSRMPVVVILFLWFLLIACYYLAAEAGIIDESNPVPPDTTKPAPVQPTPEPTLTPDRSSIWATETTAYQELEKQRAEATATAEARESASSAATATANAQAGQATMTMAAVESTRVSLQATLAKGAADINDQQAIREQNKVITDVILLLGAASASGIFLFGVGVAIQKALEARQREHEAALRLLHELEKLEKSKTVTFPGRKSHTYGQKQAVELPKSASNGANHGKDLDRMTKYRSGHMKQRDKS